MMKIVLIAAIIAVAHGFMASKVAGKNFKLSMSSEAFDGKFAHAYARTHANFSLFLI